MPSVTQHLRPYPINMPKPSTHLIQAQRSAPPLDNPSALPRSCNACPTRSRDEISHCIHVRHVHGFANCFPCAYCGRRFSFYMARSQHIHEDHPHENYGFPCLHITCNSQLFTTLPALLEHQAAVHHTPEFKKQNALAHEKCRAVALQSAAAMGVPILNVTGTHARLLFPAPPRPVARQYLPAPTRPITMQTLPMLRRPVSMQVPSIVVTQAPSGLNTAAKATKGATPSPKGSAKAAKHKLDGPSSKRSKDTGPYNDGFHDLATGEYIQHTTQWNAEWR